MEDYAIQSYNLRVLTNAGSLHNLVRFLRASALRSANLLNKADLARDTGSSRREEKRIAQGETLGDRLPKEFPPRRGGEKRAYEAGQDVVRLSAPTGRNPLATYLSQGFTLGYSLPLPDGSNQVVSVHSAL